MRFNRKKQFYIIVAAMILIGMLSGCQLARVDYSLDQNSSSLCGVFVTIGLDKTKYYQDAMNRTEYEVNGNGELKLKKDVGKITLEGKISDNGDIVFDQVKGYYLGRKGSQEDYYYSADPGFTELKCSTNATDDVEEKSCEATILMCSGNHEIIDIHPVYWRDDGSIYVVISESVGYLNTRDSSGAIYSQTLSNEITKTEKGVSKKIKDSFKVNIAITDEAKKLTIKEMNTKDELIKSTEYSQGQFIPQEYIVDSDASYIIVEDLMTNPDRGEYIRLSIYNMEDSNQTEQAQIQMHLCSFPQKDGIIGTNNIVFIVNNKIATN